MNNIIPVHTKTDFGIVADLAKEIWTEHYIPIIGVQQVEYMLEKFQSATKIETQIKEGILYYLIVDQDSAVSYFSFSINKEFLFLSKLDVLRPARGKRMEGLALDFIVTQAREPKLQKN